MLRILGISWAHNEEERLGEFDTQRACLGQDEQEESRPPSLRVCGVTLQRERRG